MPRKYTKRIKKLWKGKHIWKNKYYVRIYQLACQGLNNKQISQALGVPYETFKFWKREKSTVQFALKEARGKVSRAYKGETFLEYVYKQLSPEMKEVYDKICACYKEKNGQARIRALLAGKGTKARQYLYMHSLVDSNFNPSVACRKMCISKGALDKWIKNDPEFVNLMDEIHWHRGNFYQGKLDELVKEKDPSTVQFVNRTFNRNRGYGDKIEIEHTGRIQHDHVTVDITKLSHRAQREVLKQIEDNEKVRENQEEIELRQGQQLLLPHKKNGKE